MGFVDFLNGNSRISEFSRTVFVHARLYYPWNKLYFAKMRKTKPTSHLMIKAREYFDNNQERISKINSFLEDELSRDTFNKLIHMRQYYEKTDIPQYNYFDQYFPKDIIEFGSNEVFVDGGAFTGDTLKRFIKCCPNYMKIVAFEPDQRNANRLFQRIEREKIKNITVVEKGMSDRTCDGFFEPNITGMYSQFVEEETGCVVPLIKIDDVLDCKDATFIKMDIEGSELHALRGAERTIIRNKPKLAICIYHSDEDMLCIAEYIHQLVPEYKIYMRAHNMGISENVLYAVL